MARPQRGKTPIPARPEDITRILGELDASVLAEVMGLHPSMRDIEEVSLWLGGDADVFGRGRTLGGTAGRIVEIISANEEEEPGHAT